MKCRCLHLLTSLWIVFSSAFAAENTADKIADEGIADASKAIRSNPKNSGAYVRRAAARLDKKQFERAIADCSQAIALDPENAEAYHARGAARFLEKQYVAAVHDLSEAIGLDPTMSDAYYIRGLIRVKRGDFYKAISDFTSTLELDPGATAALAERADVYSKLSQFPLAVADYSELIKKEPTNAEFYNRRGVAHAAMWDLELAIADYTEAIRLRPEFEEAYYNRGVAYANMNAHESPNYQQPAPWGDQKQWRAAIADLSIAIAYRSDRADSYRYRGFAHNGVGEDDAAIADFKEVVRLNPKEWWARAGLADVYEMHGDFHKAEHEYDIAARLQKQNVDVFVHRSNFYWRRQNFERALTEANKALQLAPNYPTALFTRASANRFLKRYDLAVSDLTSAIEFDTKVVNPPPDWTTSVRQPNQLAAEYDCRGMVYEAIGEHERAIADHEEAICLEPENASSWLNLADVYQHQGKFEDAMSCYNQAIRLDPEKQLCWLGLAKLLKETRQCDTAMAALSVVWDPEKPNLMALLLRAEIYRCLGDNQRAIANYDEATRLDPTDMQIWLDAVRLSKDKEQIERALAATAKIVEAHPGNLEAWFVRAELFWLQGANNQAIGELSEVIRQHPGNAEAHIRRAQAYNDAKDFSKAVADADYALRLDPCNGHAHLQRAFAFALQHQYQAAVVAYLEAINVDPELAEPFNGLAWLLATCPDPSVRNGTKAAEYINRALQLAPDRWDIWGTRAAVFAENSDFENAVRWQEICLARKDLPEAQRGKEAERLALYRSGKPCREEPK